MATEKRLIDANVFAEHLERMAKTTYPNLLPGLLEAADFARDFIPTVDAVEVVHGRWEQVQRWATKAKYRCSVCGREIMSATKVNIEKYPYCHCGAKMDGDRDD